MNYEQSAQHFKSFSTSELISFYNDLKSKYYEFQNKFDNYYESNDVVWERRRRDMQITMDEIRTNGSAIWALLKDRGIRVESW